MTGSGADLAVRTTQTNTLSQVHSSDRNVLCPSFVYNARGYLSSIRESRGGTVGEVYWTVGAMDARGNVTSAQMGNGTQISATFDAATGAPLRLTDVTSQDLPQDLQLAWDAMGNLISRRDRAGVRDQEERFWYDNRNRLTRTDSRVNGGTWTNNRQVQTYNVAGNILTKTGLGTYTYGSSRPHAVTSAGGVTYSFDANGNVISDTSGRSFHYTTYDLIRRVSQDTSHTEFHYDAGRQRTLKRELSGTTVQSRTHYVGNVEVVWNGANPGAGTGQYRRTIGGVLISTFFQSTGVVQTRYMHRDHLGSIVAISNEYGQVVAWMGFDPWGLRRNADAWHPWTAPPWAQLKAMLAITPRGFTGHEHVDNAGIIHMNGRIYDPRLGRFLQADPFIEDTTTLNRYTYVHNNPLAFTDPSGYFSWKKWGRVALAVAITVYSGGTAAGAAWGMYGAAVTTGQAFAAAVIGGALAGAVSTGTVEGALWGAFSGAVFFGIGQWSAGWGEWAQGGYYGNSARGIAAMSVAHGTAGGTISLMQGGKFGHGFASAGVTKVFSPAIANGFGGNRLAQGAMAAVVGGTTSRITGGKFANGAVTAAMAYSFNQLLSDERFDSLEEAVDRQLEETKQRHSDLNRPRSASSRRPGAARFESDFEGQPIGGFVLEDRRSLGPLRFWRTGFFRISRTLTPSHAWGQVDSFAAGAASDAAALVVYTDSRTDTGLPNFSDVSRQIGAPVFVQHPSGDVFRHTASGCSVFRGEAGSC